MDSLNERSINSHRRFKSSPDINMIGPRVQLSTHPPLKTEAVEASFDQYQQKSSSNLTQKQEEEEQHTSSLICSYNPYSNRQIVEGPDIQIGKHVKKMGEHPTLKQLITQQKIKILVQRFVKKISRNNTKSSPVDYTPFFSEKELGFLDTQGIQLNDYLEITHFLCSILLNIAFSILSTLCLVFTEIESSIIFSLFSKFCLIYFAFEVFLNLITVQFEEGKRLGTLRQILQYYVHKTFIYDALIIVVLFIDQFIDSSHSQVAYLRLVIILKLSQVLQKIQRLQVFFIRNFYYEQYWSLVKVFLFNFSLAHILAICLLGMASMSMEESWMSRKEILDSPWPEKYAWAYYWATTIMLTVGFGDLNASNFQEAIVLTFIQMISCIALGYNISCVGMLISNIRAKDLEKGKNFKIFYALSKKNDLSQDLEWRINNYIEESSNIKKKFNHQEENHFVDKLPQGLKTQFLKESNKKIFKNLPFFRHLTERTVFKFAQKIAMRVCHPQEVVQHLDDPHNLLILKGGQIGFTCKKPGLKYNSTVIDQLKILNFEHPILIHLGFIRNPRLSYEIKSLAYSVLYFLDYEHILSILKGSQMDFQFYCLLKDKAMNMPDELELFDCEVCKEKHTKFTCPKLHFIPIKQQVINRYIKRLKKDKNPRTTLNRFIPKSFKALKNYNKNFQTGNQRTDKSFFAKILFRKTSRIKGLAISKRLSDLKESGGNRTFAKQISQIKDYFSKNTVEIIKHEVTKALYNGQCLDEVWIIESDRMKNYKYYFENDNACNLMEKWINTIILRDRIEYLIKYDSMRIQDCFNWTRVESFETE